MSIQNSNHYFGLEAKGKIVKLSEIITPKHMTNGDSLQVTFSNVTDLDKIPGFYHKITKLSLSHNSLASLGLISQFPHLTHLNVSHNFFTDIREFLKVSFKEKIVVLCLEGNPLFRHPDILPLSLTVFPRLVELDGVKINDHTRQDIADGMRLSKKLISYLCKNEIILEKIDKEVKKIKIEYEVLQACKDKMNQENGPFWEDINARHSKDLKKMQKMPKLPNFTYHTKIRPYMILDYIELVGKSLHYFMADENDEKIMQKMFKWMFCEVLLHLHSWGMHGLQLFLQENTSSGDLDQCFTEEIDFFKTLVVKNEDLKSVSDIFPDSETDISVRLKSLEKILSKKSSDWEFFPIFSCNSEYLKAIFSVLQIQTQQIEELQREKEELLSFDTSCLGIPSFSDKYNDGARSSYYDLSQENRASSRTTVKLMASPNNLGLSPSSQNDHSEKRKKTKSNLTDELFKEQLENIQEEDLENEKYKEKIKFEIEQKLKDEIFKENEERIKKIEDEKFRILNEKTEIEKKLREMEKIQDEEKENRRTQKKYEEKLEKVNKNTEEATIILKNLLNKLRLLPSFKSIQEFADEHFQKEQTKRDKYKKAIKHYNSHLKKLTFLPLRYNYILLKAKNIKADDFYNGKLLLDTFYKWKKYFHREKTLKELDEIEKFKEKERKRLKREKKIEEELMLKKDFEGLLKRLTSNEKNIKKLWKLLKNKKNCIKRECLCGGFKCQSCIKEKTSFIKKELIYLKKKILETKSKKKL